MKTVQDFLEGKIRRSELGAEVRLGEAGPEHPVLGVDHGRLWIRGQPGAIRWYENGFELGGRIVPFRSIRRIFPPFLVELERERLSDPIDPLEAQLAFAAVRWVGRALLRRPLDGR